MKDIAIVWHGHHEATYPIEILAESFESRLKTIMTVKAKSEAAWQIKRRLQLFKKVQNPPVWLLEASDEYSKARDEYYKAWDAYSKAWAESYKAWDKAGKARAKYSKARDEYHEARAKYSKAWAEADKLIPLNLKELMELHKTECGCGWAPMSRNIFKYNDPIARRYKHALDEETLTSNGNAE
jgi:hypothetical protein